MKQELLKFCIEKGLLLDKEIYGVLSELSDSVVKEIIEKISLSKEKIITKSFFNKNAEAFKGNNEILEKLCIKLGMSIEISKEITKLKLEEGIKFRNVKVLRSSSNQTKKLEVGDFVRYFRSRFSELKSILQQRAELDNLVSINKIETQRQNLGVAGIVYNKRVTKNKNILLDIEDLTGKISILVNQNKPEVYEKARDVIIDSVIGVKGTGNKELIFANEIIFPDAFLQEKFSYAEDECAAFISDIHVGSKMFLESGFLRFVSWLNGELGDEKQRHEARKIKYLLITGDCIDGIGVYPGQEALLEINDIKKQYERLADYLGRIRKDVTIIMCPGQHDAVRVAEPQPAIDREYGYALHELENVILVSNPSFIEIANNGRRGARVLMYHGASMSSIISEVESLRAKKAHDTPSKVVRYLLKIRHLSPIHSSVTYIPHEKDELLIKEVPDIITTADLHRPEVDMYNNILIICSSCWQSMTPFEEKVGNHPDPCKVPILNLRTRAIKIMDFSEEEEESGKEIECKEKENKMVCEVK